MLKYLKGSHNQKDIMWLTRAIEHSQYYLQKNCSGMCKECEKKRACVDIDSLLDFLSELK